MANTDKSTLAFNRDRRPQATSLPAVFIQPDTAVVRRDAMEPKWQSNRMSQAVFARLSSYLEHTYGIKMPPSKRPLLECRLRKRMLRLGIRSFQRYHDYVFSTAGLAGELSELVDVVTTNKTDFFREPDHFSFLADHVVPRLLNGARNKQGTTLRVWSAGCSTGEEVYSIAMVLNECMQGSSPSQYAILGTDISQRVLGVAQRAVYPKAAVECVPPVLRQKYVMYSKDRRRELVRIIPELRARARFKRANLMDRTAVADERFRIIFCRNVIIYFDRSTQERVINHICQRLEPGGFIFLGHSESTTGLRTHLQRMAPAVYQLSD